jgi:hypothetical protein
VRRGAGREDPARSAAPGRTGGMLGSVRPSLGLDVLAAVVAVAMLARNLPRLLRIRRDPEDRSRAVVPAINVALAAAVLAYAMKGIVARLI